jgi:hypothetical protein
MTLSADEFIIRFLLHVLPKGFHWIRHYGLLASAGCEANIARARQLMAAPMAEVEPPAVHDTADPGATTDHFKKAVTRTGLSGRQRLRRFQPFASSRQDRRGSTRKLPFPHARLAIDAVSSMLQPSTRGRVTLC